MHAMGEAPTSLEPALLDLLANVRMVARTSVVEEMRQLLDQTGRDPEDALGAYSGEAVAKAESKAESKEGPEAESKEDAADTAGGGAQDPDLLDDPQFTRPLLMSWVAPEAAATAKSVLGRVAASLATARAAGGVAPPRETAEPGQPPSPSRTLSARRIARRVEQQLRPFEAWAAELPAAGCGFEDEAKRDAAFTAAGCEGPWRQRTAMAREDFVRLQELLVRKEREAKTAAAVQAASVAGKKAAPLDAALPKAGDACAVFPEADGCQCIVCQMLRWINDDQW